VTSKFRYLQLYKGVTGDYLDTYHITYFNHNGYQHAKQLSTRRDVISVKPYNYQSVALVALSLEGNERRAHQYDLKDHLCGMWIQGVSRVSCPSGHRLSVSVCFWAIKRGVHARDGNDLKLLEPQGAMIRRWEPSPSLFLCQMYIRLQRADSPASPATQS
jgi:hypothetical protein